MSGRAGLNAEAVVAAAAAIADADGLDRLTLSRLAATLGVRTPSLYAHVGGLDDLHARLAVRGARELTAAVGAAAAGRSGREALDAVATVYRTYAATHPGAYAAMQVAPRTETTRAAADELVELVVAILAAYRLPEDRVIHAVRTVRAALHGFVELERIGGFGMPVSVDESFAGLLDMLDAGLRSGA